MCVCREGYLFSMFFEPVDPAVAYTITELFFLAPQDFVWKIWIVGSIKGLAHNPLFHLSLVLTVYTPDQLVGRVQIHGHVQEGLV